MGKKTSNGNGAQPADSTGKSPAGRVAVLDPSAFAGILKLKHGLGSVQEPRLSAQEDSPSTLGSIAIVDDRLEVLQLLAIRFGLVPGLNIVGQGFNGADALELARTSGPDLMIVDLRMPVMGGAEAIPLLRAIAPNMRIVVYTSDADGADLAGGNRPDAIVLKGANLGDLVDVVLQLLAEKSTDLVEINLGRLPVQVAVDAFDSWVGLNARVRHALATKDDVSAELLGDVLPLKSSELLSLMGVFMQFGMPLMMASVAGDPHVDLQFSVRRETGAAARRALLALGGNGTLRAFNKAWSHSPTKEAEQALDLVDKRLVEQLPVS